MIEELLVGIGVIGLGICLATTLELTGLVWWSFIIIFYLIIVGLLGLIAHI